MILSAIVLFAIIAGIVYVTRIDRKDESEWKTFGITGKPTFGLMLLLQ